MAYTTLKYGSTGDEVKKLQEKLGFTGNAVTGNYGAKTQAAVEEYQRSNGLTVDGIAGEQTLGKLYGTSTAQSSVPQAVQTPAQTAVQSPSYRYDSGADNVYQQALKQLEAAKENRPTYDGTFDEQLQQIYDRIMNREDFSFDLNADPTWQQLKDQHVQQGQLAMMDAMGQAAALSGGYGNTFAQRVGQQAYQQHLQALTDLIPELYQLALSRHNQEGERLNEQFALTGQLAADEYGKFQDAENRYWQGVDRAQAEADTAYDRGQNAWYNELQLKQQADDIAYSKQQDAYDRLVNLITSTGYSPTQEELTAAGMSAAQAAAYTKYYNDQNTPKYSYTYQAPQEPADPEDVEATYLKMKADGKSTRELDAYLTEKIAEGLISQRAATDLRERRGGQNSTVDHSVTGIANAVNELKAAGATNSELLALINEARAEGSVQSESQLRYLRQLAGL